MTEPRVYNADLAQSCTRCGRAFPRMYREGGLVVCRVGQCRPMKPTDAEVAE